MERPAGFLGMAQWSGTPTADELGEQIAKFIPRTPERGMGVRYTLQLLSDGGVKLVAERIAVDPPDDVVEWSPAGPHTPPDAGDQVMEAEARDRDEGPEVLDTSYDGRPGFSEPHHE